MSLDLIILSVLRGGPVHGYELKRRVQRPSLAALSNNSLYPALRRFEAAGVVTATVEAQDGRPARRVYAITELGRKRFTDLVSSLPQSLAGNEEEFLTRVSFFHEIPPAARQAILNARAATLDRRMTPVRELLADSDDSPTRAWRTVAVGELLARLERERAWITELSLRLGQ